MTPTGTRAGNGDPHKTLRRGRSREANQGGLSTDPSVRYSLLAVEGDQYEPVADRAHSPTTPTSRSERIWMSRQRPCCWGRNGPAESSREPRFNAGYFDMPSFFPPLREPYPQPDHAAVGARSLRTVASMQPWRATSGPDTIGHSIVASCAQRRAKATPSRNAISSEVGRASQAGPTDDVERDAGASTRLNGVGQPFGGVPHRARHLRCGGLGTARPGAG